MQGDKIHNDDDRSRDDTRGASTSYSATNDEDGGVGSSPTYCRPDFEDANGVEENPLGVVESVDSAHEELEGASSEHVGAAVPSNVGDRVEFIRDCGNSGCDDCTILILFSHDLVDSTERGISYQGNEEEGKVEGGDSGDELLEGRVFWFGL